LKALATVSVVLVQLLLIGSAGASSTHLHTSVTTMTWAGGVVTLSAFDEPTNMKCLVTASPTVVVSTAEWTCGTGVHTSTARLPSNDSSHPMHFRFTLNPGDFTVEVTVKSADYGGGLRITRQPSNATISADGSSTYDTTTLSAKSSGTSKPFVQWYSASVPGHWTAVKGATRRTLVVSAATLSGFVVQYEATFSIKKNSVTTRPASIYEVTYGPRWSGYVDVAGGDRQFSSVSGAWTVPAATCSAATTYQADWVGIDGQTNDTLEQAGTYETCYDGTAFYKAFYYLWGYANFHGGVPVYLPSSRDPVAPRDEISVSVSLVERHWIFTLDDSTADWSVTIPIAQRDPPPAQASAEWIVEAPGICESLCVSTSLTATVPVTFTNARATRSGVIGTISSWPTQAFAIARGTDALDEVTPLNSAGTSFSVAPKRGSV
jgi:hypothetical protein